MCLLQDEAATQYTGDSLYNTVNPEIVLFTGKNLFLVVVWLSSAHTFNLRAFCLNAVTGVNEVNHKSKAGQAMS